MHISVVINAHNEGELLLNAMDSAIANAQLCMEMHISVDILVVLDKADPKTTLIANSYSQFVRVTEVDFGELAKSRNFGISQVVGECVALLDGDDIWGRNWLLKCFQLNSNERSQILHPEFSVHFFKRHSRVGSFIQHHPDSRDPDFLPYSLVEGNPWTSLGFGKRDIFMDNPYLENDKQAGVGFEDWSFNIATLKQGIHHVPVQGTVHFIREKKSSMKKSQQKTGAIHALQSFHFH